MQRPSRGDNSAAIARHQGVHEVVVDIAIEDFYPSSGEWESDRIVKPVRFSERRYDDYVLSRAFQPAMKGNHAVLIVYVEGVHIVSA